MAKNHKKRCSIPVIIREKEMNTTLCIASYTEDHHQKVYKEEVLERVWRKSNTPNTVGGSVNLYSDYGEQDGGSLKKLRTELLYDPTIPFLGVYLEKTKLKRYMDPSAQSSIIYNSQEHSLSVH